MSSWSSTLGRRRAALAYMESPGDVRLFLHILAFALAVPALMRLPLPRVSALVEPRRVRPAPTPAQEEKITHAVLAVLEAGRPLVRRGCLTRGVTLYYFLRRAGAEVSLCFGLGVSAAQADGFDGHCWLVKHGEPYLEPRDPRPFYTQMYAFPWAPHAEGTA